jgi:hypothetical protein
MDNNVIQDGRSVQYVCIHEFEESEKQPFDTTAMEQQKEDGYLTSC